MEKFKVKSVFFLIYLAGIILGCWLISIENELYMKILLIGIMVVLLAGFVNKAFKVFIVDDDTITVKYILGNKVILWSEIDHIYVYAKKLNWIAFIICSKNDKIIIESGIKNHKRLMRILVDRCKRYNNVHIESEVIEYLKKY